MPRTVMTVQTVGRAGVDIGSGDVITSGNGAEVANDGKTVFRLENLTGGALNVTFVTPVTVLSTPALAVADQVFSVPATSERWIGPFPTSEFNDPANGLLDIDVAGNITITPVNIGSGI